MECHTSKQFAWSAAGSLELAAGSLELKARGISCSGWEERIDLMGLECL